MMANEFQKYADALDFEALKLPILKTWLSPEYVEGNKCETDDLEGFANSMKALLEYLKAENVFVSNWHQYATQIEFAPCNSPYFRIGAIGKANKLIADDIITGVIAIGFDEEFDYEENDWNLKPSLILWYEHGNHRKECTDIYLIDSARWRDAINEFFDIQKAINPPKYTKQPDIQRNTIQLELSV